MTNTNKLPLAIPGTQSGGTYHMFHAYVNGYIEDPRIFIHKNLPFFGGPLNQSLVIPPLRAMTSSVRGPLPSSLATAAFRAALALDAKTSNGTEELLSALVLGWASPPEDWWVFSWLGPPRPKKTQR